MGLPHLLRHVKALSPTAIFQDIPGATLMNAASGKRYLITKLSLWPGFRDTDRVPLLLSDRPDGCEIPKHEWVLARTDGLWSCLGSKRVRLLSPSSVAKAEPCGVEGCVVCSIGAAYSTISDSL